MPVSPEQDVERKREMRSDPERRDAENARQRDRYASKREAARKARPAPRYDRQIAALGTGLYAYQTELLAALESDPPLRTLVVRKGVQIGCSELMLRIAARATMRGASAGVWLRDREMTLSMSPRFRKLVAGFTEGREATSRYNFGTGAVAHFRWAGSSGAFDSIPVDLAVGDEWASLGPSVFGLGSPTRLLRGRTTASDNPRVVLLSSPKHTGDALHVAESAAKLRLEWKIPCPSCRADVSALSARLDRAGRLSCEHCGALHGQADWSGGRFIADTGETMRGGRLYGSDGEPRDWPASVAVVIRGLAVLEAVNWRHQAEAIEADGDDAVTRQALASTLDAEIATGVEHRVDELVSMRRPVERHPEWPMLAAADVQHDRIEVTLAQVSEKGEVWVHRHAVLQGETDSLDGEAWRGLTAFVREWKPVRLAVDSGDGNRTKTVYSWCQRHRGAVAIKGYKRLAQGRLWNWNAPDVLAGRPVALLSLAVDRVKRNWHRRLASDRRARYFGFDVSLDQEYFESLTNEVEVSVLKRYGGHVPEWRSMGPHEASDTMTYLLILRDWMGSQAPARRKPVAGFRDYIRAGGVAA